MSTIPDYNTNPGGFVGWLDGQSLDQLSGNKNPKLAELLTLLDGKITLSADQPTLLTKAQLEKLLAAYLTNPDAIHGGWATGQFQAGQEAAIDAIKGMIERGKNQTPPKTQWSVSEFMLLSLSALTMDRLDDDIITTFTGVMAFQDNKRKVLSDELKGMTAELKIYGVIQSEINKALSAKSDQTFKTDFNLMDYKLYGYGSEAQFKLGAEFKLLAQMQDSAGKVTVKAFLESDKKQSGAMSGIEAEYAYNKDNNKLGNFSTSVSDRSRPLNDQVSEKTTRLNDVSSRYNAAIEALNRFIQKYDSIMRDILGAI
ncbi:virulence-associated V antigen [Aeromonas dhakensis]|uniref:virulence-associated V antigen n=1 Tax=Aeromonas dhakensis TaxID=196024 RepID=UPI0023782B7B|nr:virulence-associated V antigen [Aeromonas dhakensis]MDD9208756.1 virulence-associated V antigen [Aeromonas dhakensis]